MAQDPYGDYDHFGDQGTGEKIREAASEHPGVTALVSLLSSPIALKLGGVALRFARRNPVLAIGLAAGAYVLWNRRQQRSAPIEGYAETVGGSTRTSGSGDSDYDFRGAAHGSVGTGDATRRRNGGPDATSVASSL